MQSFFSRVKLQPVSLRARLIMTYTALFACALLLLDIGIYMAVRQALYQNVERDLQAGTQQLLELYNRSRGSLEVVIRDGMALPQVSGEPAEALVLPNLYAQVFSPKGELLGRSPSLMGRTIPVPQEGFDLKAGQRLDVVHSVSGMRVWSQMTPLVLGTDQATVVGILSLSRPLRDVDATMNLLLWILVGGGAIALLVGAVGIAWLSRPALAPIDQVVKTAQSIVQADDLQRRVPLPPVKDELHRLTVTVNELLERMQTIFTTQRRFMADVSHELRTPLTAMLGNLEILERGATRDPQLLEESLADMRRETIRLIRMVNDLLLLAQRDAGFTLRREPVELDTLLLEVHRELRPLANTVHLRIGGEDQITVVGDRDRIKQAMINLGVNALQHTPDGGEVTLTLEREPEYAAVKVTDTGCGIAENDLPHIFDRFYRTDMARSRSRGGAGLGLSIVHWIADAHHGTIDAQSELHKGSTFTLRLPLQATAS